MSTYLLVNSDFLLGKVGSGAPVYEGTVIGPFADAESAILWLSNKNFDFANALHRIEFVRGKNPEDFE